ncbi:hypothetical protein AAFF_G00210190 [Aldrovandia affinis]|uniref:Uncharacterized protein n=1 Tax=Aldrovandia affinis TaxID=143900 RepID=A0AAD7WUY5_9TELE|nr:hypothetical protein AAFF_G00210190 [Aldrovandia affinis]
MRAGVCGIVRFLDGALGGGSGCLASTAVMKRSDVLFSSPLSAWHDCAMSPSTSSAHWERHPPAFQWHRRTDGSMMRAREPDKDPRPWGSLAAFYTSGKSCVFTMST